MSQKQAERWSDQLDGKNSAKIEVRIPAALENVFRRAAEMHGRTYADELRVALKVHVTRSTLAALPDPEIQKALGEDAARFERGLRADLRALEAIAYRRPTPEGLLVPYSGD